MHYKLSAYVRGAEVVPSPFPEPVMFTAIFKGRPDKARYAVAQRVPLLRNADPSPATPLYHVGEPTGPFVVWDLFDEDLIKGRLTGPTGLTMPPRPMWLGESEDGMIMKAVMCHERS